MIDRRIAAAALIVLFLIGYAFSLYSLAGSYADIAEQYDAGATPVLVLSPRSAPIGTVVVAHGFAANSGVMRALGADLARNGYRAVLFDFPGYGNSQLPQNGTSLETALRWVCDQYGGGQYALAGHSMGSLAVLEAGKNGSGRAVIGISSFSADVGRTLPRNMLLIAGDADLPGVVSSLPPAVANGTGVADPQEGRIYGNFPEGTAREYRYESGNHITILYNTAAYDEIIRWLDATYGYARPPGAVRHDLPFGWAFAAIGAALLAFLPALYLLSGLARDDKGRLQPYASHPLAKPLLTAAAGSLVAAAAVLLFNPASYAGLVMADRVAGFLLYAGIFSLIIYYAWGDVDRQRYPVASVLRPLAVAAVAALLLIAAIALPAGLSFYEQPTTVGRILMMALVALLTLPFFLANDLLSRRSPGFRSILLGLACRGLALSGLALSFALSGGSFFNIVILPITAALFLVLELVSYLGYRWTGNVYLGACLNALLTGWLLASAFPLGLNTVG